MEGGCLLPTSLRAWTPGCKGPRFAARVAGERFNCVQSAVDVVWLMLADVDVALLLMCLHHFVGDCSVQLLRASHRKPCWNHCCRHWPPRLLCPCDPLPLSSGLYRMQRGLSYHPQLRQCGSVDPRNKHGTLAHGLHSNALARRPL